MTPVNKNIAVLLTILMVVGLGFCPEHELVKQTSKESGDSPSALSQAHPASLLFITWSDSRHDLYGSDRRTSTPLPQVIAACLCIGAQGEQRATFGNGVPGGCNSAARESLVSLHLLLTI